MRQNVTVWGGITGLAIVLAGCAAQPNQAAVDAAPIQVPDEVTRALMPPLTLKLAPDAPREGERRFDVSVRNAELRAFVLSLVEDTPYSVTVGPKVSGQVSFNLRNVTVTEVLENLRDAYGYELRRNGLHFLVMPADLQSRTFQVDYLNLKRSGQSSTRVTSGQFSGTGSSAGQDAGGNQTGGGNTAAALSGVKVETDSESNFWKELEGSLKLLVPPAEGRSLVTSPEAGLVVVRASPSELAAVGDYLQALHANLHRQVVLEAKIIEVTLNERFQAGINWGALRANASGETYFAGTVGGQNALDTGQSSLAGTALTIAPGTPATGFASTAAGGAFVLAVDLPDFNGVLELLKSQGDVQVLSSPRISTVNNQKAIIKVGTDEFFVTGVSNNTTTGNATTNNSQIELTPFFSGIALDVTPRIYGQGDIILHVHPTVSQVTERLKTLVVSGQNQSLPLAVSNLRETDSIVRARDNQVVVIGGLMQDSTRDDAFSTPLLGDIPFLGNLFKQSRTSRLKSELVILLRPTIVDSDWKEPLRDTRRRLESLSPDLAPAWTR